LQIGERHSKFVLDNQVIFGRLIDEQFVNFENVIPHEDLYKYRITVNRDALLGAVKRMATFVNPQTSGMTMEIGKDTIKISAEDIDGGIEAKETISCVNTGELIRLAFNTMYLENSLAAFDSPEVVFKAVRADYAVVIDPSLEEDDEHQFALVMPIRLEED